MSNETSPSRKNYNAYIKGKEPLKNAILLQPDDKINDYIKKNTNRRFWTKDYESFKASMMEDAGAMGLAPGEGNPIAPTPNALGSGDKFPNLAKGNKKKDKKKEINESYGDAVENFEYHLDNHNIDTYNEPEEFGDINGLKAEIHYEAEIEYNKYGIENVIFVVNNIILTWETKITSPEDIYDENSMIEDKHFNVQKPQNIEINKHALPFYPTNLAIYFNQSADPKHWKFEIDFGREGF